MAPSQTLSANKGDIFCRPTDKYDVAKFFLFNYGLHALTVIIEPGSGAMVTTIAVIQALLCPYASMAKAIWTIARGARFRGSPIHQAHWATALCMELPPGQADNDFDTVVPYLTNIHGHGSKPGLFNWTTLTHLHESKTRTMLCTTLMSHLPSRILSYLRIDPLSRSSKPILINVPLSFTVETRSETTSCQLEPLSFTAETTIETTSCPPEPFELQLASNYNILKILVSIFQTVYGAFELYAARGNQLNKYGYAAYALTVVPYTMMSVVNLLVALCQPQYPSKFVVVYGGKLKSGTNQSNNAGIKIESKDGDAPTASNTVNIEVKTGETVRVAAVDREKPREGTNHNNSGLQIESDDCPSKPRKTAEVAVKIDGTVGVAYGNFDSDLRDGDNTLSRLGIRPNTLAYRKFKKQSSMTLLFPRIIAMVLFFLLLAMPYIVMKLLTNFDKRQSTKSQRTWILVWLAFSQYFGPGIALLQKLVKTKQDKEDPAMFEFSVLLKTVLLSVPSIGVFVVVARMILDDVVCIKI